MSKQNGYKDITTRNGMKVEMYKYLFSSRRNTTIVDHIFNQFLPSFSEEVYKIKISDITLATQLQKKEVEIFIPIWEQFANDTLPLHDGIYYPIGDNVPNWSRKITKALEARLKYLGYKNYKLIYGE